MSKLTRNLPVAARILLGLPFFVFGLNGFLHFMPQPELPAEAGAFMGALAATGYMFPVIKGIEVVAGLMLLAGFAVPLALLLLAPIVVNIVLFHAVLAPAGLVVPVVLLALGIYLAWAHRDSFRGVLQRRARPASAIDPGAAGEPRSQALAAG